MPVTKGGARAAFTLIELLVVMAIVALLASILLPAFARARENAKRAGCWSNLKQLSQACMLYGQDYDEMLPMGTDLAQWGNFRNPRLGFVQALYPYVKCRQAFYCTSADAMSAMCMSGTAAVQAWALTLPNTDANWAQGNIGYQYYSFLVTQPGGRPGTSWPARTLSLNDEDPAHRWLLSDPQIPGCPSFPHAYGHAKGLHVVLLDGHIKPLMIGRPVENFDRIP